MVGNDVGVLLGRRNQEHEYPGGGGEYQSISLLIIAVLDQTLI